MPFSTPMLDEHASGGEPEPLGARLKALREAKGQSINDVVEATNIPADKIEAIENGTIIGAAPTAYARGFVRLYAEHLETDVEAVVEQFERLCHPEDARLYLRGLGPMSHKDYRPGRRREDRRAVRIVLWVILLLAVLALAYYGLDHLGHWLQSIEKQAPSTPSTGTSSGDDAAPSSADMQGEGPGITGTRYALTIEAKENARYKVEVDGLVIVPEQVLAKGKSYPAVGKKSVRVTLPEPAKVTVYKDDEVVAQSLSTDPIVVIYDERGFRTEPADGNPADENLEDVDAGDVVGPE